MPGNEFGERTHNFFGQENLSQGQLQSQVIDGSWPGFSNGLFVSSQKQIGSPHISNLKDYSAQQTVESERGQSSSTQHGLNFTQESISRTQSQNHQPAVNGYKHGNQVFQKMQNEANFLGVDTESDRHRLTSRGVPPDLHKNSMRLEMGESPVNHDFFGGQQQINSQFPSMLQTLPRQQTGINDMQLLQQQVMLKQIQEFQRQQQLKQQLAQLEAQQLSSLNQVAVNGNRPSDSHSRPLINGVPVHEISNNSWQSELMTANTNWLQRGISPAVQGSSSGLMFSAEQGQLNLMGSVPQQFEQSFYGVPVSSTRGIPSAFGSIQADKLAAQHMLLSNNSFPANQFATFSDRSSMPDNALLSRPAYQEKSMFSHVSIEGSNSGINFENLQQVDPHQRNISVQDFNGRQDAVGPSEKPHEKVMENVTSSSQNVATLDPTEEKILFGSDDNLWDALGNSTNMSSGGNNIFGGSDLFSSFSSMQSGSWSALMQSAVAETSSSDTGLHDLSSKRQSLQAGNKMQTCSVLNPRSFPQFDNTSAGVKSHSVFGPQQSGFKASNAQSERLNVETSQAVVQQFPDDHSLSQKPMPKHNQTVGNIFHSSNAGINTKNVSCSNQQNISASNSGDERGSSMHEFMGGRLGIWKAASNSNSAGPVELKSSSTRNQQINRESSELTIANSSTVREDQRNSQQHPNIHKNPVNNASIHLNSTDGGVPGTFTHHMDQSTRILGSSAIDSSGKVAMDSHEMGNSTKDNSNDDGFRDGIGANASDSSFLPSGKQNSSFHLGRRPSVARKFQYHPMGDIDVEEEPSFREKVMHSQPTFQQVSGGNQGYSRESKSHDQMARNMGIEKGHLSEEDLKSMNEVPQKGKHPDCTPGTSATFVGTVDGCNQVKASSSSQNMLELLHKVDQSREHDIVSHLRTSRMPEGKSSDGSGGQVQHNQSSASQGFNLQLALPSQSVLSQSSLQAHNSLNLLNIASEKGGKSQSGLASWLSNHSLPDHEAYQGARNVPGSSGQTKNSISGLSCSKGYPQNQHTTVASGQLATGESVSSVSERFVSQQKQRDESGETAQNRQLAQRLSQLNSSIHDSRDQAQVPVLEAMPASQPSVTSGMLRHGPSSGTLSDSWADISIKQHQLGGQPSKPHPDLFKSHLQSNNSERSFSGQQKADQMSQYRGEEIAAQHPSDASPLIPRMAQSNFASFCQSFTPNNIANEKNSSLHQNHTTRNAEDDQANRSVKRIKGPDGIVDPQQAASRGEWESSSGSDSLNRDGSSNRTSVALEDFKTLGFLSKMGDEQSRKASSHDMLPFSQNVSQSSFNRNLASIGADCQQISPQMAPSWFDQNWTSTNGQVLPINDRFTPSKITDQSPLIGKPPDSSHSTLSLRQVNSVDPSQLGNAPQSSGAMSIATEPLASFQPLPHSTSDQSPAVVRPKKRKTVTFTFLSWNTEVTQGSQRLQTVSEAEVEWSRLTNRLAEKLESEAELIEDVPPVLRSKRRLIVTTQLMQQLLQSPPTIVISSDASLNYESVLYAVARTALGDACSSSSSTRCESSVPLSNANPSTERPKTPERIGDQYISKAMEDSINRTKKLETDFLRAEKGTSIADLRLEIQDLEKFSVINRFAKFHARGQPDGAERSSSMDVTGSSLKLYPQRYVTALPMPRNVPDGVQCLSL